MASLSVRKVNDDVVAKLRIQAARNGVSMEEEVRQILEKAVFNPKKLGDMALQYFGDAGGVDLDLPVHKPHEPIDLSL